MFSLVKKMENMGCLISTILVLAMLFACQRIEVSQVQQYSCQEQMAVEKTIGARLTRETVYEMEHEREKEFEALDCNLRKSNRAFIPLGTHLDFWVKGAADAPQTLRLQPEYFRTPGMTHHNLTIPRTADNYQSRIWLDTLGSRALCFLLVTTLDYNPDDSLRGSLDEYFWVIELNPLRQLFYCKTLAAGYKWVPERTQFTYIHNDEVHVASDTIWISDRLTKRVSAYGLAGDTIVILEERQAVNPLPTLQEM